MKHKSANMSLFTYLFTRYEEVYIVLCNGHNGHQHHTILTVDHRPPVARTGRYYTSKKKEKKRENNNNMESD